MGTNSVRLAAASDIDRCLEMGRQFFAESGYADFGEYNEELTGQVIGSCIDNQTLLIADGGMIGFVLFPIYVTGTPAAQELFWWVDHDKRGTRLGLDLLRTAEAQAKKLGAEVMIMLCLDRLSGGRVGKLYERLGYEP